MADPSDKPPDGEKAMSRVVIRVDRFAAGQTWRVHDPPGFWLGPTPYGYGINWSRSMGRADYEYYVVWPEPYDPVCFEWEGDQYVFALEGAGDDAIDQARPAEIMWGMGLG
jgi:hypothetical protein